MFEAIYLTFTNCMVRTKKHRLMLWGNTSFTTMVMLNGWSAALHAELVGGSECMKLSLKSCVYAMYVDDVNVVVSVIMECWKMLHTMNLCTGEWKSKNLGTGSVVYMCTWLINGHTSMHLLTWIVFVFFSICIFFGSFSFLFGILHLFPDVTLCSWLSLKSSYFI